MSETPTSPEKISPVGGSGPPLAAGAPPERPARIDQIVQLGLVLLLVVGCWRVLRPFAPAILFSLVIAVSTWPVYAWLLRRMRGRRGLASTCACGLVALAAIVPASVLVMSMGDGAAWLLKLLDEWKNSGGGQAPEWLGRVPLFGQQLQDWWRDLAAGGEDLLGVLIGEFAEPLRRLALAGGRAAGNGLAQTLLGALLLFFFYRDGEALGHWLERAVQRLGGNYASGLLATAQRSVVGVMFSVIGTAMAQAVVATIGFAIAGVPAPFLLGTLTFVLSMAPIGPPLIWAGAALWLFRHDRGGWAVFMLFYGFFLISSVDNLIKPFLISRSSHLPFALTFMGVIGGVLAFGVSGIFVGPTVLALALNIGRQLFLPAADGPPAAAPGA